MAVYSGILSSDDADLEIAIPNYRTEKSNGVIRPSLVSWGLFSAHESRPTELIELYAPRRVHRRPVEACRRCLAVGERCIAACSGQSHCINPIDVTDSLSGRSLATGDVDPALPKAPRRPARTS